MPSKQLIRPKQLAEERYSRVLCYPRVDPEDLKTRINELENLGVEALEFTGEKRVHETPVVGKGYVGIVVAARRSKEKVALKIRRVDADRNTLRHEAQMLRRANAVGVGPTLFDATENFLLMEFVEGRLLPQWLKELEGKRTWYRIRRVLRAVLEKCWTLDDAGLDHGELSKAPKHIIISKNDKPHLVDFESASINRRVSNVTSICQYLFIGSPMAKNIQKKLGQVNKRQLTVVLRLYKKGRTRENFEEILKTCRLYEV